MFHWRLYTVMVRIAHALGQEEIKLSSEILMGLRVTV